MEEEATELRRAGHRADNKAVDADDVAGPLGGQVPQRHWWLTQNRRDLVQAPTLQHPNLGSTVVVFRY